MRDKSDRYQIQTVPRLTQPKRLGSYLVDAGLLTPDQITVVLNDQQATGMRFGEIVAARGWLKEQTIEWIVEKVVEVERLRQQEQITAQSAPHQSQPSQNSHSIGSNGTLEKPLPIRREVPISKPLPSINSSDSDVTWVG
jgi:hypothetical protein